MVAVLFLGACAWGESSSPGGDDDDGPPPDAAPVQVVCGDQTCAPSEVGNCPSDCGGGNTAVCGNAACETGETNATCPQDCPPAGPVCGDTVCDMAGGENSTNCPGDCTGGGGGGGGGNIDCNDEVVLFSCFACLSDPTSCSGFGVTEEDCAACAGI